MTPPDCIHDYFHADIDPPDRIHDYLHADISTMALFDIIQLQCDSNFLNQKKKKERRFCF